MITRLIPNSTRSAVALLKNFRSGRKFGDRFVNSHQFPISEPRDNELRQFFNERKVGAGIWKWDHYFDLYERHLKKFRGRPACIVEVGIYSGGSLEMWEKYFGPEVKIIGVDIEPACKQYERSSVDVYIGDQADRDFWARFRMNVPNIDAIIDDGGHQPRQQIVTFEELTPCLNSGGVYICEDAHGTDNHFMQYMYGLASQLNSMDGLCDAPGDAERRLVIPTNRVQNSIQSIAFYPFVVAVEMHEKKALELIAPKHGTQWQPFLP